MTLSPREYEVARLFALGRTWLEVMAEMHIGRETVSKHRRNAMERADVGVDARALDVAGMDDRAG